VLAVEAGTRASSMVAIENSGGTESRRCPRSLSCYSDDTIDFRALRKPWIIMPVGFFRPVGAKKKTDKEDTFPCCRRAKACV